MPGIGAYSWTRWPYMTPAIILDMMRSVKLSPSRVRLSCALPTPSSRWKWTVPVVVAGDVTLPTLKSTLTAWLRLPLVPVTVSVKLLAGVEFVVERVSIDDPDPLTEDGLKLAVTPLGRPLALNDIALLNPFKAVTDRL